MCKRARRRYGSMIFEVVAPCIFIVFYDFLLFPHVNFRFAFGSILEAILDRFGIYFWSFGLSKSHQIVIKIVCDKCTEKDRFREVPSPRKFPRLVPVGGDGEGKPPPLGVGG